MSRLCLAVLAALLATTGVATAAPVVIKIATMAPDHTPWSELLKKYKSAVQAEAKKVGQEVDVKIFLGGVLGDENETVLKCKRGQVQAVGASTGALASQVPEINVVELPFLFRDADEADHVLDTALTTPLEKTLRGYGFVFGFWSENGFRQIGTKDKPVHAPADLVGKKMRSQESLVHLETWTTLGAQPVPIPTTEALSALETGTVDGFDQAALFAIAANWYKTVKYFTITDHIYQPALIVFNTAWFEAQTPELQKILIDEGRKLQAKGRKAVRKILPDLEGILTSNGVQVYKLTPAERAVFEEATRPVRAKLRAAQGASTSELLDLIEKTIAEYRAGKK